MTHGFPRAALALLGAVLSAGLAWGQGAPSAGARDEQPKRPAEEQGHGHEHGEGVPVPEGRAYTEGDRLDELIRQFVAEYAAWAPSTATYIGIHDYDTALEDRNRITIQNREKELESFRHALSTVIESSLDDEHRVDLLAFRHLVQREIFELTDLRAWATNPMYYTEILSNAVYEPAAKRFASPETRVRAIIAREARFPELIAQAKENLENPPEIFTRKAIDLSRGTIDFLEKQLPGITNDILDDSLSSVFLEGNARAVIAMTDYVSFLENDLLPRSTGDYALGADRFARLLRVSGQFTTDPAALLKLGESELDRTIKLFKETAKAVPGKGNPTEKLRALEAARPDADSVVAITDRMLSSLRDYVANRGLITVPEGEPCRAAPMPPFMWGFAALNAAGPFETVATESYFYVKTGHGIEDAKERDEVLAFFNPWNLAVISIHEAYPGHFVQGLVTRDLPTSIRKLVWDYANAEGWAHYTEQLVLDDGFGADDPRYRLCQLREAMIRLTRFVVAIKMHTKKMSIEDGAKLFRKKALLEPAAAREEAERGAFDPGYLNYTLGKMAIIKLREDWKAQHPADYSARAFHDRFLSYGPIPIPMIRSEMLGGSSGAIF